MFTVGHSLPVSLCGCRWVLRRLLLWRFRRIWQREFLQRHRTLLAAGQSSKLLISPLQYSFCTVNSISLPADVSLNSSVFCSWPLTPLHQQMKIFHILGSINKTLHFAFQKGFDMWSDSAGIRQFITQHSLFYHFHISQSHTLSIRYLCITLCSRR